MTERDRIALAEREVLIEAMIEARHRDCPTMWPDGYSEGVARIERMKAEWMLDAVLRAKGGISATLTKAERDD